MGLGVVTATYSSSLMERLEAEAEGLEGMDLFFLERNERNGI